MSTPASINERIEAAHRQVRLLRRQFRRGAWLTAIVGILLLGLLAFYFAYGYKEISYLLKADTLVNMGGNMLDDQLPKVTATLETEVTKGAPEWAKQASEQMIANAPAIRQQLQDFALERSGEIVEQITVLGEEPFKKVLKEHRPEIKEALDQLATKKSVSQDVLDPLHKAIEAELQVNMQAQAAQLLGNLIEMNQKQKRLLAGRDLNPQEQIERRVLMIMRCLQTQHVDANAPIVH